MVATTTTSRHPISRSAWFWAWALVGFVGALCAVSLGPLLFFPVLLVAALMWSRPAARRSAWGLITGGGGLLLLLAWVQRSGDWVNPLPLLVVGIALFVGGLVAQLRS
jgi:hypothetical protein